MRVQCLSQGGSDKAVAAVRVFTRVLLISMWHLSRLSEDDRCPSAPGTNNTALWG